MSKKDNFITFDWIKFKNEFDDLFPTMKAYLEKKGAIIPVDAFEMTDLFIDKAFKENEAGKLKVHLQRGDFQAFHDMIEIRLMEDDSRVKRIIKMAVDSLQKKNRDEASKYLLDYAKIKKIEPGLSKQSYIKKIGRAEKSNRTYDDWMNKYDRYENELR